jgi:hypothetical protein
MLGLGLAICAFTAPQAGWVFAPAYAQAQTPAPSDDELKQALLTEAQITQYIAAQKELQAIFADAPNDAGDTPDPKTMARLQALAKKYKFASYDELNDVSGNIALVLDGVDARTKKYLGSEVVLKQSIAEVQADKTMKPADKKEALAELNQELKSAQPLKFPANVDLVMKHYDQLETEEPQK